MFVQVRMFDSDTSERIDVSLCESIAKLKEKVADKLNAGVDLAPDAIRLFFDGKELLNELTIFDYRIKLGHVIQVLVRKAARETSLHDDAPRRSDSRQHDNNNDGSTAVADAEVNALDATNVTPLDVGDEIFSDKFYAVGDFCDALEPESGAWFEANIHSMRRLTDGRSIYCVRFIKSSFAEIITPLSDRKHIRPPSCTHISFDHVAEGDVVLANFNVNQVDDGIGGAKRTRRERGLYYDALITKKDVEKRRLYASIFIGDTVVLRDQRLRFLNELYVIHQNATRDSRDERINEIIQRGCNAPRVTAFECNECKDDVDALCTQCCCKECGSKRDPASQIICDECQQIYHAFTCLPVPLAALPPEHDDWYCPDCKNDDAALIQVREREALLRKKLRQKQQQQLKMPQSKLSDVATTTVAVEKKWGRGMACVGRTRVSLAAHSGKDYFGAIPGVDVGTWWRFRVQASEAGVHTPLVAGICGKENVGASSIVVSCAYADDIDLGDEIYYTGSGGRDSDAKKGRVGGRQTRDQELKRCNKALAVCCASAFNDEYGANARDNWRQGKPVRVLRSGNSRGASKRSKYLPECGVRYDGIYKVVKYWPERNDVTGLRVWRFLLRRDDPQPSPWSKQGKARAKRLGLHKMLEPTGWIDTAKARGQCASRARPLKRKLPLDASQDATTAAAAHADAQPPHVFRLPTEIIELVNADAANSALWSQLSSAHYACRDDFVKSVEEAFRCMCCLDIPTDPITTRCKHNICLQCLERAIESAADDSERNSTRKCPVCRQQSLPDQVKSLRVNVALKHILTQLFAL